MIVKLFFKNKITIEITVKSEWTWKLCVVAAGVVKIN